MVKSMVKMVIPECESVNFPPYKLKRKSDTCFISSRAQQTGDHYIA